MASVIFVVSMPLS